MKGCLSICRLLISEFALLAVILGCGLQMHAQDSSNKGAIGGTVVDGVTQQPLSGAEVSLRGPFGSRNSSAQTSSSGADGRFSFSNLEPGRYMVWASHSGYLGRDWQGGARNRSPVILAGQHIDDMIVALLPGGVIAGHVLDEKSKPLKGASIHAMKLSSQGSSRDLSDVAQVTTTESGEYRFSGLNPGDYVLRASYVPKSGPKPAPGISYAPICYPSTSDFSSCQQLSVRAGEEMAGIDLTFTPVRTMRVEGSVVNSETSSAVPESQISLLVDQKGALVPLTDVVADAKGHFQFSNVAPGDYTIVAQRESKSKQDRALWGMKTLSVAESNVVLKLEIAPGIDLRGHIRVEGNAPADLAGMVAAIEPVMKSPLVAIAAQPEDANVQPDGSFVFHDVMEGMYKVNAFPVPAGMYLKAANPEIFDSGIAVGRTAPIIDMTLSPGVGKIQGTVTGSDQACVGVSVLVVPERRVPDPRDFRRAFADQSCRFTLRNVVPGDYKVFAWPAMGGSVLMNPGLLDQYQDQAEAVHVKEGGEVEIQVGLITTADSAQ